MSNSSNLIKTTAISCKTITTNYKSITHILHAINSGRVGQNADVDPSCEKGRWTKFDRIQLGTAVILRCSESGRQGVYAVGLVTGKDDSRFVDTTTWPDFRATHLLGVHWLIAGGADSYIPHSEVEKIIKHEDMMVQPLMALNTYDLSSEQMMALIQKLNEKKLESARKNPFLKVA